MAQLSGRTECGSGSPKSSHEPARQFRAVESSAVRRLVCATATSAALGSGALGWMTRNPWCATAAPGSSDGASALPDCALHVGREPGRHSRTIHASRTIRERFTEDVRAVPLPDASYHHPDPHNRAPRRVRIPWSRAPNPSPAPYSLFPIPYSPPYCLLVAMSITPAGCPGPYRTTASPTLSRRISSTSCTGRSRSRSTRP